MYQYLIDEAAENQTMIDVEEMKQRLLALLEESHCDNALSLLNSSCEVSGELDEVTILAAAVSSLSASKLVEVGTESFVPRKFTRLLDQDLTKLLDGLTRRFTFKTVTGYWDVADGKAHEQDLPYLALTPAGIEAAIRVMTERGGIWWQIKR